MYMRKMKAIQKDILIPTQHEQLNHQGHPKNRPAESLPNLCIHAITYALIGLFARIEFMQKFWPLNAPEFRSQRNLKYFETLL